jgi:transcriptional regulator with XRE-family HTH domain
MPRTLPDHEVFETARLVLIQLIEESGLRRGEDVAAALRMAPTTLSDRLAGRTHLTLADIHRAADFFNVSPQVFFTGACGSPLRGSPAGDGETAIAA